MICKLTIVRENTGAVSINPDSIIFESSSGNDIHIVVLLYIYAGVYMCKSRERQKIVLI